MIPDLHPDRPRAAYREIANDAEPPRFAEPGEMVVRQSDEVFGDDAVEMAIIGVLVLIGAVFVLAAVRGLF